MRLTRRQLRRYLAAIPAIRAGEILEDALVAQFPYLTAEARRDAVRKWERAAGFDDAPARPAVPEVAREDVRAFFRSLRVSR
jgi:hypothetical protein